METIFLMVFPNLNQAKYLDTEEFPKNVLNSAAILAS
jgi:hypothetical protein